MAGVGEKAELPVQLVLQLLEHMVRRFQHDAAALADEVLVGVIGKMPLGRAVPEVDVIDDAQGFEGLNRPIHGGQVYLGVIGLDLVGQLLDREMVPGVEQGLNDHATRCAGPATIFPQ
jgi:hypothetical protein